MTEKLKQGIDFYYNEKGQLVFTEHYHLSKGYCCGMGCRHCPYDHEAVSASRKQSLAQANNQSTHAEKNKQSG